MCPLICSVTIAHCSLSLEQWELELHHLDVQQCLRVWLLSVGFCVDSWFRQNTARPGISIDGRTDKLTLGETRRRSIILRNKGLVVAVKKAAVSYKKSCYGLWTVRKLKTVWLKTAVKLYGAIKRSNFGIMPSPHSLKFDLVFIIFFVFLWIFEKFKLKIDKYKFG
jgi:hypothetical protein